MPNEVSNLLTALTTKLQSVTLSDNSQPFVRVVKAADLESQHLAKIPETQVLSQNDRTWDEENPELGTQQILLDCFTRDITQKSGENQVISDTGLNSVADAVREQVGHNSGGPFGAACTLVSVQPPIREDVANKVFRYRVRLTFEVIWG